MTFNEIIKQIMHDTANTHQGLADKLGIKRESVTMTLSRPNITLSKFITILNLLGYEVIVRRREGDVEMPLTNK